jgi:hypothetical protein
MTNSYNNDAISEMKISRLLILALKKKYFNLSQVS